MSVENPMKIYATVFGYLVRTQGKIQTSKVNKLVDELGYDKINIQELKDYIVQIEEDPELSKIVKEAQEGTIDITDLEKYGSEEQPFKEKSVHNVITPYAVQHHRVLKDNREFSHYQRQGAYAKMLWEDIKQDLTNMLQQSPLVLSKTKNLVKYSPKKKTAVLQLSDMHIGATINSSFSHGGYNYEILKNRMAYLLEELKEQAILNEVEAIYVVFAGDLIEGADMRGGQKWGLEFSMSEQITRGIHLLQSILMELETIAPVTFAAIRGNHDRLTGQANKQDTIYNDSAVYVALDTLKLIKEAGGLKNTTIVDNSEDMYTHRFNIYDKHFVLNHGDTLKGKGNHFSKFIEDRPIDYLITGHIHSYHNTPGDKGSIHMVVGSPMGSNDYSKENHFGNSAPSQTIMIVPEKGHATITPVFMEGVV